MAYYTIKGLDNGYLYTKDNEHRKFKSACCTYSDLMNENNCIIINGKKYYFGTGCTCNDTDKINSEVNKICTLANIAMTSYDKNTHDYFLVVNLPMGQYKNDVNKERLVTSIMNYNRHSIIYKGKEINYFIHDVLVLPQCFVSNYLLDTNEEKIIVDIGSNTFQFALFKYDDGKVKLTKEITLFKGLLHLYRDIINEINSRYNLNYEDIRSQYYLMGNPLIDEKGKQLDLSFMQDIVLDYMQDVLKDFKLEFPYKTTKIYITGGGAELLFPIFQNKNNFPSSIKMKDAQFTNAEGLYLYGKKYCSEKHINAI